MKRAIGIHLGLNNCCVGVWRNGRVEIVPNENGERTTPAIVSFTENNILIGELAKDRMTRNYENTVYDFKFLIGRKFEDEVIQKKIKLWPFKVIEDTDSHRPLIQINYKNEKKCFYPEEITGMLLSRMKQISENYLGHEVNDAVITVPALF